MSRALDADLEAQIDADSLAPIQLVEIGTSDPDNPVRAWSGLGDLIWNGATYIGTGIYGKVSAIEETNELKAGGVVFELSGVPSELLAVSLSSMRWGRSAKVWFAALDGNRMVGEPYQMFAGLTDVPEIVDDGSTVTIRITAENRLIDLERPRERRYTPEDQKITDASDLGFSFVAGLQDWNGVWGQA
jgi:hypothetical protein